MNQLALKNMTFKAGSTLKISGVPKSDCASFAINIGHGEDNIALHFNPRFNQHGDNRVIVLNSQQGGCWCDERRESSFPFQHEEEFKVSISFSNDEFQIKLSDGNTLCFPNRLGDDKYRNIYVDGEVKITGIKIK